MCLRGSCVLLKPKVDQSHMVTLCKKTPKKPAASYSLTPLGLIIKCPRGRLAGVKGSAPTSRLFLSISISLLISLTSKCLHFLKYRKRAQLISLCSAGMFELNRCFVQSDRGVDGVFNSKWNEANAISGTVRPAAVELACIFGELQTAFCCPEPFKIHFHAQVRKC